jgi:hypothetical protein
MKCLDDLLKSLLECWIAKAEPDPSQSNVGEHSIGLNVAGPDRTEHELGDRGWQVAHTQWTVCEAGKRGRELEQPDRRAIHEEIAAAHFAGLGKMNERAGTIAEVNG